MCSPQTSQQETFIKYDAQNRQILTGMTTITGSTADTSMSAPNNGNLVSQQNYMKTNQNPPSEARNNSATSGYDGLSTPIGQSYTFYTISYYDDYLYPGKKSTFTTPTGADLATRGEVTGTRTGVLGSATTLYSSNYYDYFGRSLKVYKQHYLGAVSSANNFDAVSTTYDFTNVPTTTTRQHWNTASTAYPRVTVFNKYIYDHMGRRLKTWEQLTNTNQTPDTARLISLNSYNEIGQVYNKKLHSNDSTNYLQSIGYLYNERGWLLKSNSPLFEMQLQYNLSGVSGISPVAQYNGNIASQSWGTSGSPNTKSYLYTYDKMNRMLAGNSTDNYKENTISYDLNGNITALQRTQGGTLIDNLAYTYGSTNRLQSISDATSNDVGLVHGTTAYTYDMNGNALSNANTASTGQNRTFTYNVLNLPNSVTTPTTTSTVTYDAAGDKLRKVSVTGGTTTSNDYISGIQYKNSTTTPDFIQTEEGRATPNGATTYDYQYYLGDNLGNTRVTFGTKTGAAVTYQTDDYYPFGLEISRGSVPNPKNEYLYNGKEEQEEFGQYDYGARLYDPVVGRWNTIDKLAEKYHNWSPYSYVLDNPIRLIDEDGMAPGDPRWFFYKTVGKTAIDLAINIGGYENRMKGLYLIAQRRVENGFKLEPKGNNPMNIKGQGDLGQINYDTHEYVNGESIATKQNFAAFSSVDAGMKGYVDLVKKNDPDAYNAIANESGTFSDFITGMQKGGYATDINYEQKMKSTFKSVVNDYIKMTSSELSDNNNCVIDLIKQSFDPNLSTQEKTDNANQIRSLNEQSEQLRENLKKLKEIK